MDVVTSGQLWLVAVVQYGALDKRRHFQRTNGVLKSPHLQENFAIHHRYPFLDRNKGTIHSSEPVG